MKQTLALVTLSLAFVLAGLILRAQAPQANPPQPPFNQPAQIQGADTYSTTGQVRNIAIMVNGKPAVNVNFLTGKITYDGYTPDQAARIFWDAVGRQAQLGSCLTYTIQ